MTDVTAGSVEATGLERLSMLASALSGCDVQVASGESGDPAWTDGHTVFIDPGVTTAERLQALAVQASLLAGGSLAPDMMRKLSRRPALAKRYLAVEGHRALAANEDLLPPRVRALVDCQAVARTDSPTASLAAALSREPIPDPPPTFGAIRARKVLATQDRAAAAATSATEEHAPRQQREYALPELGEDENDGGSDGGDPFSSPVGGGGAVGRLLQKMLGVVRQLGEGGTPGADAPTHRIRSGAVGGANAVVSRAELAESQEESPGDPNAFTYPEWDVHRRRYRPDWCTVREVEITTKDEAALGLTDRYGLRRPLARLGVGLDHCHRRV